MLTPNSPPPQPSRAKKGTLVAIVGAAAAALLVPMVGTFEGKRNNPYANLPDASLFRF